MKKIEVYIYDNNGGSVVQDHLIRDYNGGDCCKAEIELPEGFDAYENVMGELVIESTMKGFEWFKGFIVDCMYWSVRDCKLYFKIRDARFRKREVKILSQERVSAAMTLRK